MDLSTQSCTVELRDEHTFALLGTSSSPLPETFPPVSEHDPNVWWSALKLCLEDLRKAGVSTSDVAAISVGAQCHGLVPLDKDGTVIRRAKLWNDTESSGVAEALVAKYGKEYWVENVGTVPTAAFTISKLGWLIENEPQNAARIAKIVQPHDYLTWRFTGRFTTDRSEASGTGYFSSFDNKYLPEMLLDCWGDFLPWDEIFPEVLGPTEHAGVLQEEVAAELNLPAGIVVGPGGGDQHLAALGLGVQEGDFVVSLGTSGVVFAPVRHPVKDLTGGIDGVASVTGGWLPLICTLNCTKVTDRMALWLGTDLKTMEEMALSVDPAAPRPIYVPYLDGERTPALPHSEGVFGGLTGSTSREQLALCAYEGVVLGLWRGFQSIVNAGVQVNGRLIVVGGGANSAAYRQVVADMFGRVAMRVDAPEATARGACLQALAVLNGCSLQDVQKQCQPQVIDTTQPRDTKVWSGLLPAYEKVADFAASTPAL